MKNFLVALMDRRITVIMLVLVVFIIAGFSILNIPLNLLPDIKSNVITVIVKYPGQSPWRIESIITRPIEEALTGVGGIKSVVSSSKDDESKIFITFDRKGGVKNRILEVRAAIDMVRKDFPRDVQEPEIYDGNNNDKPVIIISLTSESRDIQNIREYADDELKARFKRIDGVSEVIVSGGFKKEVLIQVQPEVLAARGINYDTINRTVKSTNINSPVGNLEGQKELTLLLSSRYKNIEEIYETPLFQAGTGSVLLVKDIAKIKEYSEERDSLSKEKGKEIVSIYIFKASTANSISLSENIKDLISKLENDGIKYDLSYDEAEFIKKAIMHVVWSIIIGGFLASFVLIMNINSIRQSFSILFTMPVSVMAVIIYFFFSNMSFNIISLSGFAIAVGMLVDNGIVFIERFNQLYKPSEGVKSICSIVIKDISSPILASTISTSCIFLPFVLFNKSSDIYHEMAGAFITALFSSFFFSLIIIPTILIFTYKNDERKIKAPGGTVKKIKSVISFVLNLKGVAFHFFRKIPFLGKVFALEYENLLRLASNNKRTVLFAWSVMVFCAVLIFMGMPNNYGDMFDRNEIYATMDMNSGTTIERTAELVASIENTVMKDNDVINVSSNIKSSHCDFIFKVKSGADRQKIIDKLQGLVVLPVDVSLIYEKGRDESESNNINIEIKGSDVFKIRDVSNEFVKNLYLLPEVKDVIYRYREGGPQLEIEINRNAIGRAGLSVMEVADHLRNAFYGPVASKFVRGREYDIRSISESKEDYGYDNLRFFPLIGEKGKIIPLGEMAEIKKSNSLSTIWRKEKARFETLTVTPATDDVDLLVKKIKKLAKDVNLPENYEIDVGSSLEDKNNELKEMAFLLAIAVSLIFIVLTMTYESFIIPAYVFFAIPAAFAGGVFFLKIAGRSVTMATYMGLLVLFGIAVNNTILLIDRFLKDENGLKMRSFQSALNTTRSRMRAINMTTMTTVLGLVPMLFSSGVSFLGFDFAATIISGMLFSRFCILHVFPIFFIEQEKEA